MAFEGGVGLTSLASSCGSLGGRGFGVAGGDEAFSSASIIDSTADVPGRVPPRSKTEDGRHLQTSQSRAPSQLRVHI